jgi:hypothetical protein
MTLHLKKEPPNTTPAVVVLAVPPTFPPIDPANILTPPQLAEGLHRDVRWLYEKTRLRCGDLLPCILTGRFLLFDWTEVSSWLRRRGAERTAKHAAKGGAA